MITFTTREAFTAFWGVPVEAITELPPGRTYECGWKISSAAVERIADLLDETAKERGKLPWRT